MQHASLVATLLAFAVGCATPRAAELPTATDVDRAVAAAFGDPATEMDFTERSVLLRCGAEEGSAVGAALPSLVYWQRVAPDRSLVVGEWRLRLLPPGKCPEGSVALCDISMDGGKGFEGTYLSLAAAPLGHAARARVRLVESAAAELPTAAEVDEAVAARFGPPEGEIHQYLDFTGVSACTRYDVQRGRPMVAALPSLFCWQERGPAVPLRVRAWELRVLRTPQDQPAGAVRLYDFVLDGGLGSPGCSLYLCATPLTAAARKRAEELAG